jgi:hypothetical protein
MRPVAVEPVKEIIRTFGSSTSAWPTSPAPGSTCSSPSGSPASSNRRASATPPDTGVLASGFSTTALPSASAGPTERMASTYGKFQGVITPTTPTGTRRAMLVRPGVSDGSSMPSGCETSAAAMSSCPIEAVTSTSALPRMQPDSRTSSSTSSARWRSIVSAARLITATRSVSGVAAQSRWAAAAEAAARATEAASPPPAVPSTSPVAGSTVSIVAGASTQPSL